MKPARLRRRKVQPSRKGTVGTASAERTVIHGDAAGESKQLREGAGFSVLRVVLETAPRRDGTRDPTLKSPRRVDDC